MNVHTEKINQIIGRLLRLGVFASALTVMIGWGVMLLQNNFQGMPLPPDALPLQNYFSSFYSLLKQGSGVGIVILGILLMIATPILRLVFSLFLFLKERDFLYVAITLLVIGILIWSVLLGG